MCNLISWEEYNIGLLYLSYHTLWQKQEQHSNVAAGKFIYLEKINYDHLQIAFIIFIIGIYNL